MLTSGSGFASTYTITGASDDFSVRFTSIAPAGAELVGSAWHESGVGALFEVTMTSFFFSTICCGADSSHAPGGV